MVAPIQKGIKKSKTWTMLNRNIPSAISPVPHCEGLHIREPSDSFSLDCYEEEQRIHSKKHHSHLLQRHSGFFLNVTCAEPHKITQKELPDLNRDLELSKNKAELLSSGIQQWNLLMTL
jgi:hypothetical protein